MSSAPAKNGRALRSPSAVRRQALPGIVVFAAGSALALVLAYQSAAVAVRHQFDAMLISEAADMALEAKAVPAGEMSRWLAGERADLVRYFGAFHGGADPSPQVILVVADERGEAIGWSGIDDPRRLLAALAPRSAAEGPENLHVEGIEPTLRTTRGGIGMAGGPIAILAVTNSGQANLFRRIALTLAALWAVVVSIGTGVSWWSVRRVLRRVERLGLAAAAITEPDGGRRIPEAGPGDEIGRLAATLNGMLDRIAVAVAEIRGLSQSVAHDLRSPVTVIRGRLEMALTGGSSESWRDDVAEAIEGLDRLAAQLEAILDVAEAEGGALRIRRSRLDLGELCRELVELYAPAFDERGLRLRVEAPESLQVEADPHLLRRAVANLLDNALRHAVDATKVQVTAKSEGAAAVVLQVEDDGIGLPEPIRERAFERSTRRPGSPGFGLGLPLVRAVARAHGGDAWAGVGSLGGTRILVRLPLS